MDPDVMTERSLEEQEALAAAARESMRRQVVEMLRQRNLLDSPELSSCPRCGDPIIILSQPATWVKDRTSGQRICAPCGTEMALLNLMQPGGDEVGGEG